MFEKNEVEQAPSSSIQPLESHKPTKHNEKPLIYGSDASACHSLGNVTRVLGLWSPVGSEVHTHCSSSHQSLSIWPKCNILQQTRNGFHLQKVDSLPVPPKALFLTLNRLLESPK